MLVSTSYVFAYSRFAFSFSRLVDFDIVVDTSFIFQG